MISIKYKNLKSSDALTSSAIKKIKILSQKFPQLKKSQFNCTLSMINSPFQRGTSSFSVRVQINEGQYKGIALAKKARCLHIALSDVMDRMHERLKRKDEKIRKNERTILRRKKEIMNLNSLLSS
jgi:ribosome-associated translation inhibitor RaiA